MIQCTAPSHILLSQGVGFPSYSLHQLYYHAAERGAVVSDSVLRHRFGVALESRLGFFGVFNTIARLLVLAGRSVRSGASPDLSQTQTGRSGPNTCREATHLSRAFLMQATAGHEIGALRFAVWNSESRDLCQDKVIRHVPTRCQRPVLVNLQKGRKDTRASYGWRNAAPSL